MMSSRCHTWPTDSHLSTSTLVCSHLNTIAKDQFWWFSTERCSDVYFSKPRTIIVSHVENLSFNAQPDERRDGWIIAVKEPNIFCRGWKMPDLSHNNIDLTECPFQQRNWWGTRRWKTIAKTVQAASFVLVCELKKEQMSEVQKRGAVSY